MTRAVMRQLMLHKRPVAIYVCLVAASMLIAATASSIRPAQQRPQSAFCSATEASTCKLANGGAPTINR